MRDTAPLKNIILSILFVVASVNFVRTTLDILKSSKRLEDAKSDVSLLEQQKAGIQKEIEYKKSLDYVEEKARNELNMVKDGETVYVVSGIPQVVKKTNSPVVLGVKKVQLNRTAIWRDNLDSWWQLFF